MHLEMCSTKLQVFDFYSGINEVTHCAHVMRDKISISLVQVMAFYQIGARPLA